MKEKLIKHLDLKILALLFAVILWLIVVNIDDPVKTVQFSGINVQILHASDLEKQGYCYDVIDGTDTINVSVTGRRSVIEEISKENITATADMKDLTSMNTISIKVASNKSPNELDALKTDTENVKVEIEKLQKKTKTIVVETEGELAEGYILGSCTLDLNQVDIKGPESVISTIDSARASLDVEGASSNVSASVPVYLYDANGERVDSQRVSVNINNVNISQEVLYSKTVPVEYIVYGAPAEGYAVADNVIASTEEVTICGRKSVLDNVVGVYVSGEDALNVTGLTKNTNFEVNLKDFLPVNVSLSDSSFDGKVSVTAQIRRETYTIINKDLSEITIYGVPNGKKAEILSEGDYVRDNKLVVRIYGLAEKIGEIDEENLLVELDLEGYRLGNNLTELANGTYTITPDILLPSHVRMESGCVVSVRISDN